MRTLISLLLVTIFLYNSANAKNAKKPELDNEKVHLIKLEKEVNSEFKSAYLEGTLESGELKLKVEGLSILQRVMINIVAADPNQPIDIVLLKNHWDDVVADKKNLGGLFEKSFHVYGNFGIKISSKYPEAKFYVAVFTSPELKPSLQHLFYPADQYTDDDSNTEISTVNTIAPYSNNNNLLMYVIAFLLFIIILLLILFLFRRQKSSVATILILFFFCFNADAGVFKMNAKKWQEVRKVLEIKDMTNMNDFVKTMVDLNKKAFKIESILKNLLSESNKLHVPSIDPRGLPSLPSSCIQAANRVMAQGIQAREENIVGEENIQKHACQCLEAAYEEFYDLYLLFEQLRIIKEDIVKSTDAAIAFGDNVSGGHFVSGLAWQKERKGIVASMDVFYETYDNKLLEFLERLHANLQEIDKCEHELGFSNWYRRVGFMYYQFTKVRYER